MFEVLGLGAEFTFDAQGTERISDVVGRLQSLDAQMNRSTQQTLEYSNTLNEFANILGDMGKQMIVAGTATTAAALYGVGKAAEWQTQMIDAGRYMTDNSTESQTAYNKALKETAQLLGRTKEEINASTISYMMMGKSTDEALQLAKNAGYAAVTWDMTADSVADSFRSIKAAFNVNLEDQAMYQKYLDTINEVGNSTAATSRDVVEFLADGGAALHNVANVSIEQAMGMASAARYANMSIAEFSTMMTRLGNQYAQDKSTEYFTKLGIEVKDANGEMRSFAEVLYDVQKQWNDLDQATKSNFASGVGGVYADRLSLYMGSGEEYLKGQQIANQDNTGSAEAEFQRVTDTFAMAISRMKVTLSDFGTAFWGTLLPPLTKLVNVANKVVTAISNFAQAHPAVMKLVAGATLLTGVFVTLTGVGLMVASMFAKLRASQVLNHFATLRTSITMQGLGVVFKGLATQMGPLILKFGKLAGSMGLVYLAWKYDLFNIRSLFESFITKFKLSFENAKKLLDKGLSFEQFQQQVQQLNNSDSVFDKLALGIAKVGLAWQGLTQYFSEGALSGDMFDKLNAMGLMPLISIIIGLQMRFSAFFTGIKEGFISAIETINTWVKEKFGPPLQWLHDNVLLPVAKAIFGVDENCQSLSETVGGIQFVDLDAMFGNVETWERVGKAIGTIAAGLLALKTASTVINVIVKVAGIIGKVGSAIGTFISWVGRIGGAIARILPSLSTIGSAISSAFSGIGTLMSGIGNAIMWVLGGIGTVVTAILGACGIVVTLPAWVVGAITVAVVAIIGLIIAFRDEIWNFLTVTLPNAIGIAIDWIVNFFTVTIPNALQTAGEWLYNLFTDTIPSAVGYAIGWLVGNLYLFFTETLPGWIDTAVTAIGTFFTETLPEVIGSAIDAIGTFFTETLPEVIGNAIDVIGTFFTETLPNAIGTAIDAIGNFVTVTLPEFFASLPEKLAEIGQNIWNGLIDGLTAAWNGVVEAISNFIDGFVQGFKDALGIHSPSTVFADIGMNVIQGLIDGISGMIGSVVEVIGNVVSAITDAIGGLIDGAIEWGSNLIDNIGSGISSAKDWVVEKATGIGNAVKNGWNTVTSTAAEWGSNLVDTIGGGIESVGSWIGEKASGVADWFKSGWDTVTSTASEWGSNLVDTIGSGIESVGSWIGDKASDVGNWFKSGWENITSTAGEWGSTVVSNISNGINSAVGFVSNGVSNVANAAKGVWDAIKGVAPEWGVGLMNNIESGISSMSSAVTGAVSTITSGIETTVNGLKDKALSLGSNMMSQYKQGIEQGKSPIESAISTIGSTVKSGLNSLKDSAISWGSNMVDGFANGIKNAASKAASAASSVVNSVKNFLGFHSPAKMGEGRHIVEWGYNMVSGFADGINSAEGMLSNTMASVITNPVKDVLGQGLEMPLTTNSQVNSMFTADTNLSSYLGQIISLLSVIAQARGSIISGQTESYNGSISRAPITEVQEKVQKTESNIVDNNTKELNVNIEKGAIENHYHIEGGDTNKEELMELIEMMMDESLLPLLKDKIRELKIALNE